MKRNILWGVLLLLLAFLYLFRSMGMMEDFPLLTLALVGVCIAGGISRFAKRGYSMTAFGFSLAYYFGAELAGLPSVGFITIMGISKNSGW